VVFINFIDILQVWVQLVRFLPYLIFWVKDVLITLEIKVFQKKILSYLM